jgi:23S rRNA (cytosine1962-C5)-methyltransferase
MTSPAISSTSPRVFLQAGRDRRVVHGHPWVYSNEIRMDPDTKALPSGIVATLHRVDGKAVGIGTFNPHALIAFRLFDRDSAGPLDEAFLLRRLKRALDLRGRLFAKPFYRLVHAEADGLPGLIADRFGDVVVLQINTAGMEVLRPALVAALEDLLSPAAIVFRNDARARALEGLEGEPDGSGAGDSRVARVEEDDLVFSADLGSGQKTGWYFDQRDNRAFVAPLAAGGRMLDAYCYAGGFAIAGAKRGATEVIGIDSSQPALDLARVAADANGVGGACTFRKAVAFSELERLSKSGERFRVVVADPPAFVKSRKDLNAGLRGYRKLSRLAVALVEPGGFLFVASCSHNVAPDAFAVEVAKGLSSAGRSGRIIRAAGPGPDHPIHPHLPETAYLKTLLLQVD